MSSHTTSKFKVTELDFDLIKNSLKDYLKSQTQFVDYDFEGSGMAVLLDLLSYNTHYNAFYTNMIANEMFLDSTTLRSSAVSLAKQLGYTPRSVTGAKAKVTITFNPNDLGGTGTDITRLGSTVAIPKGSVFLTELNNKTYGFVSTGSHTATPTPNTDGGFLISSTQSSGVVPYTVSDIEITQGVYSSIQYAYNEQIKNQQFIIPNEGVDISTITVLVTDTLSGTSGEIYTLSNDYAAVTSDSKVFFVQETLNSKYEIYFGDGNIGASPVNGNIIDITYIVSEGDASNGATIFKADPIKSPFYGVNSSTITYAPTVSLVEKAAAGAPQEDLNSIKYLAPRNYEAQNRAVTTDDYVVKVLSDYPQLDAVRCWGGEENDPPEYGKVYLSIKPVKGYILSDTEKENIKKNILKSRNVITVEPVLVDPEYIFLVINAVIKWDSRLTPLTDATLMAGVRNEIVDWGQKNLEKFETYFRYSRLVSAVDDYNAGVVNNEISVKLRAEIVPTLGESINYTIKFANPLYHPHAGHQGTLSSSIFTYTGHPVCTLRDVDGVVQIVSGQLVVSSDAGTIDYTTGKIVLIGFVPKTVSGGGTLSITVKPNNSDIVPNYNQLLTIRDSDLLVSMLDDSSVLSGTVGATRASSTY
jgi:hypothetical protein